jgi:hypothetical protein
VNDISLGGEHLIFNKIMFSTIRGKIQGGLLSLEVSRINAFSWDDLDANKILRCPRYLLGDGLLLGKNNDKIPDMQVRSCNEA